jgi:hypothetical protein
MTIKASDLSDGEKQNLLDALRKQIGDSQYNELLKDHDEDFLVEMVLQILNQKSLSGKETNWERVELGCFGVLWLILTFGVALFWSNIFAVLFFISPSLYILIFQPSVIIDEFENRIPKGCAVIVVVLIWVAIIIIISKTMPEELLDTIAGVVLVGAALAGLAIYLVEFAVKLIRRWKGQR